MKKNEMNSGVVYSTAHGRMCPGCGKPIAECSCRKEKAAPSGDGIVRVARETKGRKGKGVTLITGVPLEEAGLKELAKTFKARYGVGGAVKDGVIELQGDHRDEVIQELQKRGWTVKRAGG